MNPKLILTSLLIVPFLAFSQGIIGTASSDLITVTNSGTSNPDGPNLGVSVTTPTANLDVEGAPLTAIPSNLRFRNLPVSNSQMVLVNDSLGYVTQIHADSLFTSASNAWLVGGNTNGSLQNLGTNDAFDLPFVTGGTVGMRLTVNGAFYVGNNPGMATGPNIGVGATNAISSGNSNLISGWGNNLTNSSACIVSGQNNVANNSTKSAALGWGNTLDNHNQYLIGASNSATNEYSGAFGVGLDLTQGGSWYLGGNTGTTLTNDRPNSLAIGWANAHTGLFNQDGLTLGTATGNTTVVNDDATARLDVEASAFTSIVSGAFFPSGVRFRNLPHQFGTILVKDPAGYVYDSGVELEELMAMGGARAQLQEENEALQDQIDVLAAQIDELTKRLDANSDIGQASEELLIIYPNPTNGNFTVRHFIPAETATATVKILSTDGQILIEQVVTERGVCDSRIDLQGYASNGSYVSVLELDGEITASKILTVQH